MCAHLERIETAGPGAKARRLVFDDGLEPRMTAGAAVKELRLEPGMTISRDSVEASLADVEPNLARERALRLLGYREHSSAELYRKLVDTGYPASVATAVVSRFQDVELLDDQRFAAAWTRSRTTLGYGARRIRQELAQRGIDPEVITAVLEECSENEGELERARRALGGRTAHDRASRDKLLRRLVTRGFSLTTALSALDSSGDEVDCSD